MPCSPAVNDIILYALTVSDVYYAKVTALHANGVVDLVYGGNPPSQHAVTNVSHAPLLNAANRWACTFEGGDVSPHF